MNLNKIVDYYQPFEDLLKSVRVCGTFDEPMFKAADVAEYIGDIHYDRAISSFGLTKKVKLSYKDDNNKQTRHADFLTECGLYEYLLMSKKPKVKELREAMISFMVEDRRKLPKERVHSSRNINSLFREICNFPCPENLNDQARWYIVRYITTKMADGDRTYFSYDDVSEQTRNCVKECIETSNHTSIYDVMEEARRNFGNLLVDIDQTYMPLHRKYARERELRLRYLGKTQEEIEVMKKVIYASRSTLGKAVKSMTDNENVLKLIGCKIYELMDHLESQFYDGMHWDNKCLWHIDHIIPCALFDIHNPEEREACFNWKNLQPLWAYENSSKGCTLTRANFDKYKHQLPKSFVDRTELKFIGRTMIRH